MGNPITVKILDSYRRSGGPAEHFFSLTFEQPRVSLAELIRRRVLTEMASSSRTARALPSLIELDDKELLLNSPKAPQSIDPEKAVAKALSAFRRGAYFVIVDGEQITELEQQVELADETSVEFFRLMPLVGG